MRSVFYSVKDAKILVVGSIYNHLDKFDKVISMQNSYDFIIFNGNISFPFETAHDRINYISSYVNNKILYNLGNYDLEYLKNNYFSNKWLQNQPNVIVFEFSTQSRLTIVNGGVKGLINKKYFENNLELSFIHNLNNIPWHEEYGGNFGYIISNNPLDLKPNFYNYSAQIGIKYIENKIYAQEVNQYGLQKTILL